MTTFAISWPEQGPNGRSIRFRARLVITDVPDDVSNDEVLAWVDDDSDFDHAHPEDQWDANEQLTAPDAPHVQWRGRPGRPAVGPIVNVRLDPDLLAQVDADADAAGESRAAAIRRLLAVALK
jgi:hypothetical protein